MIKPAPKVEAATAEAAEPSEAALAESPSASSTIEVEKAPSVSLVFAKPPSEIGSIIDIDSIVPRSQARTTNLLESLRASNKILFESTAAVVHGQVQKTVLQKIIPRLFDERSCVSFGEVKRYVVVVEDNCYVFSEATDPTVLYAIPLNDLQMIREDPSRPHFRSHTVSPEANTGLPRRNLSRETLSTVLMINIKGEIVLQLTFDCDVSGEDVVDRFLSSVAMLSKSKGT